MDDTTAKDYADIAIEYLREQGVITESAYGKISTDQIQELADRIKARNEE